MMIIGILKAQTVIITAIRNTMEITVPIRWIVKFNKNKSIAVLLHAQNYLIYGSGVENL